MQSMVLWYDLKKQGATNENMATTPTLIDHSGNGHDATCYNFAWSGMSGIGGYTIRPFIGTGSNIIPSNHFTGDSYNLIGKPWLDESGLHWQCGPANNPTEPYKLHLNVSGIVEGNNVYIHQYNNAYYGSVALVNGENRIQIDITQGDKPNYPYLSFHADSPYETDIHIEILPEYPNALVSDGVDDYCLVEGLPLLNKEDGYTVIAKRKWIGNKGCLSHKRDTVDENGAFQFERYYVQGDAVFSNFSFGERTGCPIQIDDITYQTTASYNGKVLNVGDLLDNNFLQLFHYGYRVNDGIFSSIALHSFILFNRDLSTDEIEWVKTNLIESEQ